MIQRYKLINNLIGWAVFLVAATVYLLTIEPSVSLWDCGEFIACANKLEVGHPPGAPLFLMIARFFALFAGDNLALVPKMVNAMSAIMSALTILLLFWTITRLAKKLVVKQATEMTTTQMLMVIGSGVVGALAYTFSDTFWFSAVEGEVYAMSSFFTAVVFWAILKWEDVADQPYADRWVILIAYLMGLSIGVHLLNLLAIPAIVFVYYFRKYTPTRKGVIAASVIGIMTLALVMYGMIQGSVRMASKFELFFVNGLGMGYDSGFIAYIVILISLIGLGIWATTRNDKPILTTILVTLACIVAGLPMVGGFGIGLLLVIGFAVGAFFLAKKYNAILNTAMLIMAVILIGYSSYALIVVRSAANTPMDENNPENAFTLLSYLNREQYGDRPLFFGPYYNAPLDSQDPYKEGKTTYIQRDGKYIEQSMGVEYNYDSRFVTFFPRMYSPESSHVSAYKQWGGTGGEMIKVQQNGEEQTLEKPTFGSNLKFFFTYQLGFMYMRYFMWNFAGRQNDEQGHGGILYGNWISGFDSLDQTYLGNQDKLPKWFKEHPARNKYYLIPLILGLLGLFYQLRKNNRDFTSVMLLFFFTGIAIVLYLNQTPYQPRERDYAYAGSFYAYCIWIGLGVLAVWALLQKVLKQPAATGLVAVAVCSTAPALMASENWNDHDRSGRFIAHDFARNYLESCAPNAVLFTNGDNDTFPLWYAQEVEGIRTDVRVVCLPLLSTDWYIQQMQSRAYESAPLPIMMPYSKYQTGTRDYLPVSDKINEYIDLKQVMDMALMDDDRAKVTLQNGDKTNYLPTKKLKLAVDSATVMQSGALRPSEAAKLPKEIQWTMSQSYVIKNEIAILDLLANNNWKRPVYFTANDVRENLGLGQYLQNEGFAYRLTPLQNENPEAASRINTDLMYNNLMNKCTWGRMNQEDVWVDHFCVRTIMVMGVRQAYNELANALITENKKDSAAKVLARLAEIMPEKKVPFDYYALLTAQAYYRLGDTQHGNEMVSLYADRLIERLAFIVSLSPSHRETISDDEQRTMAILQRLIEVADMYKQTKISEDVKKRWKLLMPGIQI